MKIELLITGINPTPWQAPEFSVGRKGKSTFVRASKSASLEAYQRAIKECVQEAYPDLQMFPGNTPLIVDFFFWRQLDSGTTGEGKRHRAHVSDRSNILKATEDALEGVLYPNDKMIVGGRTVIVEQSPDTLPVIQIFIQDNFQYAKVDLNLAQWDMPKPPGNVYMRVFPEEGDAS